MSGVLYIVATPIGNLEDITLRALRVLKEVDLIAAEDTRHTRRLLGHYGIGTALASYHEHNEKTKAAQLIQRIQAGSSVALVCDAGTPLVSDPGYRLVREAIAAGVRVVPIPGPSALTAVLGASGLPTDAFAFEGFLPAKKAARRQKLTALRNERRTMVFYEVPHRLEDSLKDLLEILGNREAVIGREVTKIHEEFLRGALQDLACRTGAGAWRGEITLVVAGAGVEEDRDGRGDRERELMAEIAKLRQEGMRVKDIAELLGEKFSVPKKEVYRLALASLRK